MGNEGLVMSGKFYILLLLFTHYVFSLLWSATPVRLNGLWRTNVRDHPTVSTHCFLLFPHHPLCRRKVTSGTCYYKAYPLMSGFSPVVIPMGKWAIFTCKYGSVNGFNDVLLYDMLMGNEGFVASGWYSIYRSIDLWLVTKTFNEQVVSSIVQVI